MEIHKLLAEREGRQARLSEEAEHIAVQLRDLGALKVILFGSTAHGQASIHSDLDIIAVMPGERGFSYWSGRLYDEIERSVAVDFLPYSEQEFAEIQQHSRLIRHALRTGKILYEKGD